METKDTSTPAIPATASVGAPAAAPAGGMAGQLNAMLGGGAPKVHG